MWAPVGSQSAVQQGRGVLVVSCVQAATTTEEYSEILLRVDRRRHVTDVVHSGSDH